MKPGFGKWPYLCTRKIRKYRKMKRIIHLCSFSRQGIADASIALLFWLNKNAVLLAACLCGMFQAEARPDCQPGSCEIDTLVSLWIRNGERQIYGILSKPRYTGDRQPVAIISHGFNGTGNFGRSYFGTLNALGYQCYTFDFPCGSIYSRSDNNTMNMSVLDEQSDLEAIVRYFQKQPDVDPDRIVLIGESQGGLVSALTAARIPKEINKLVLIYPALCIPDNWNERYPDASQIPDTTRMWNVPLGRRYFTEVRDIKVFRTIPKFRGPVLIIQGDADPVVSMEDSRRAVQKYKDARLHVIPGAGHGFKEKERAEAIEQIRVFLTRVSGR